MGLSGLNSHRKHYHFIENANCPNCQHKNEDPTHFLLVCPAYAAQRVDMIRELQNIIPTHQEKLNNYGNKNVQKELTKILLTGILIEQVDEQIFRYVSIYIQATKRLL